LFEVVDLECEARSRIVLGHCRTHRGGTRVAETDGVEQVSRQEKLALPDHRSALHLAIVHPEIDPKLNDQNGKNSNGRITTGSGLLCLVIPTNEELMIARETDRLVP
jgi:acetate kinase